LADKLKEQKDPRILGNGDVFDKYLVVPSQRGFYEKYRNGVRVASDWVNQSDFRPDQNAELH